MKTARRDALLLDPMLTDIWYAARSLRRDLGVTVFSIAIAGLGIGASTTVFGLCRRSFFDRFRFVNRSDSAELRLRGNVLAGAPGGPLSCVPTGAGDGSSRQPARAHWPAPTQCADRRGSNSSTASLIASVRAALRRADPNLPVAHFRTMRELVDRSVFARRFVVMLVTGFAVFGVVLSALGVYAVISYSVSQRTQEIGIRMALGATAEGVRRRVLADTGRLAVLGLTLGLPLSWMAARAIRGLLYDVGSFDAVTFGVAFVALVVVAACGGYLPARRATRVDPVVALRSR